jgi:hypothetical protein
MPTLDHWVSVVKNEAKKRNVSLSSGSESRIREWFRAGDEKMIDKAVEEIYVRSGYKLTSEERRDIKKDIEKGMR